MTTQHTIDTVVIGAGHAGLAVSRLLTAAGRDHVVLDRGRVGERWRTARWDSLRLLTPTWMTRLPDWRAAGEPDSFLSASSFVRQLERYAELFDAPVVTGTTVERLIPRRDGTYDVPTDHGTWRASSVVVATGPHGTPRVPHGVGRADLPLVTSNVYRSPDRLSPGGVLVVGASASGVQIAEELARSGRDVVLAVGRHTRMPRRYRGLDIYWWLESTRRLERTIDDMPDAVEARREPSLQLVGRAAGDFVESEVDLAALQRRGVRLTGRLMSLEHGLATFDQGLAARVSDADRRMHRLLDSLDRYVERSGLEREVLAPVRPANVPRAAAPSQLDLRAEGIATVILATGFRPDFSWIKLPVLAADGSIRQRRGVTEAPGVYTIGQPFQHRRDSAFIDGARHDARHLVAHLTTGEPASVASQSSGLRGKDTE